MRKQGMIQLDVSHFSNVVGAVQRTASLTGGAVRGLPGGVVIDGLPGVSSFASSISEAQKEFQLGRTRTSLERIKQLENQFNGLSGRWNATVMSVISGARQGRQAIPQQKLNEVKNAQTRMQQLMGPANKAFRDLVTALEHEITMEGYDSKDDESESEEPKPTTKSFDGQQTQQEWLGEFASSHQFLDKLQLRRGEDRKVRIFPTLQTGQLYYFGSAEPSGTLRLVKTNAKSVLVEHPNSCAQQDIDASELISLIKNGVWLLGENQES